MSDYIPHDLWPDILAKLPAEDIVRCSGVCKPWYSLVTSSAFLSLQNRRFASLAKKNPLLLVRSYESTEENYSVHLDDNTLSEYKSFDVSSFETWKLHFTMISCLNGLVCLTRLRYSMDDIVLWNPSIRKNLKLPRPIVPSDKPHFAIRAIGFGFDATSNDFKVVRVIDYWGERRRYVGSHAEVYKLSKQCWRRINPLGLGSLILRSRNQVFLQGAVHWIGGRGGDEIEPIIVSFDIRNEVFDVMSPPSCLSYLQLAWDIPLSVSVMGESLCLIHRKFCGNNQTHCIWVMKQYGVADSWTKLFDIRISDKCYWRILCFQKNGEALMASSRSALYSYDPNRNRFKELRYVRNKEFEVVNFMESLVLFGVKGQHGMETRTEEDVVISKGCPDVHTQKKMKIQASGDK